MLAISKEARAAAGCRARCCAPLVTSLQRINDQHGAGELLGGVACMRHNLQHSPFDGARQPLDYDLKIQLAALHSLNHHARRPLSAPRNAAMTAHVCASHIVVPSPASTPTRGRSRGVHAALEDAPRSRLFRPRCRLLPQFSPGHTRSPPSTLHTDTPNPPIAFAQQQTASLCPLPLLLSPPFASLVCLQSLKGLVEQPPPPNLLTLLPTPPNNAGSTTATPFKRLLMIAALANPRSEPLRLLSTASTPAADRLSSRGRHAPLDEAIAQSSQPLNPSLDTRD
ncbi:uncharacterized protein BDZ99DRAFT_524656 [Mytilinidion resinicola]|uniref:Uncharacterized protein n=1 Tax=Mytilinidion resinicola TaxID=574789 RepID=A0A6A6YCZ0_9PEZI|nr:uncharacterized protein BDZ99DRAFT_524656 [Mytilinidion resinicola]KAF2805707.1 hypothetical protein BDZ99DRAFT_524656 [Mytilinidion resinicola]